MREMIRSKMSDPQPRQREDLVGSLISHENNVTQFGRINKSWSWRSIEDLRASIQDDKFFQSPELEQLEIGQHGWPKVKLEGPDTRDMSHEERSKVGRKDNERRCFVVGADAERERMLPTTRELNADTPQVAVVSLWEVLGTDDDVDTRPLGRGLPKPPCATAYKRAR